MTQLADAQPYRFTASGQHRRPPLQPPVPDVAEHERTKIRGRDRRLARSPPGDGDAERKPGALEELARRRGRMNPRLG